MSYEGMTEEEFRSVILIGEIQRYEGNCWATTLSMLLRCHGFNVSQKYVTDLFHEWRFEGVTSDQMRQLVNYFNKYFLNEKGWLMKSTSSWSGILQFIDQFESMQVFVEGHFVLLLGFDSVSESITYFDPWNGAVYEVSIGRFEELGGTGETVYMHQI